VSERNRRFNQYCVAWRMAAAFLVTLGIGCTKAEKPAVISDTAVAPAAATVATDNGLDDVPGRDTARTRAYLAAFDGHWATTPESVTLDCEKDDCASNAKTVHIDMYTHELTYRIDALQTVDKSIPDTAHNKPGHIVLKLVNRDAFEYKPLGLAANDTAYLWAGKTDRRRAFAVFRIDRQGRAYGVARAYRGIRCVGEPETSSKAHVVGKNSCEPGRKPAPAPLYFHFDMLPPNLKDTTTRPAPGIAVKPLHESGVWFSCDGGCCQANTFGLY
jgi:hypothetical protein